MEKKCDIAWIFLSDFLVCLFSSFEEKEENPDSEIELSSGKLLLL